MYAFGKVMRRLIDEHETSQSAICRETGLSKQSLSWICKGETQYPSIHTCRLLSDYFGLTLDEFWALIEQEGE